MTLRERVKHLCKEHGISMNKLENELNFGKGYISKLGSSQPNVNKLQQIADYFSVSLDYLMSGESNGDNLSLLTAKDERDIAKDMENIRNKLKTMKKVLLLMMVKLSRKKILTCFLGKSS